MAATLPFVLGSSSPARLQTLRNAGINPVVICPEVDESSTTQAIDELTTELAARKALAVLAKIAADKSVPYPFVLVCCDSMLELEGRISGKPGTPEAAIIRWYRMRGRSGLLVTGHYVAVVNGPADIRAQQRVAATEVTFADLTDDEIKAYVATGEPQRVAGGFTIDGFGGPFVTKVNGDPHNVVGISLPLVRQMLHDLSISWHQLWQLSD